MITAAWWALALWPTGDTPPAWLVNTRAVCFGAPPGGRPNFGGWLFLVGEPAGLLAMLFIIAGRSLRAEFAAMGRWLNGHRGLRTALITAVLLGAVSIASVAVRPATGIATPLPEAGAQSVDTPAPPTTLVDQHGATVVLRDVTTPAIVTVAFAHCEAICPTTVRHVMSARAAAGRDSLPLFIVTVDPWRDTAERLPTMAKAWSLGATDHVLSGDTTAVVATLDLLGVGRQRNAVTGEVAHAVAVFLLDGRGRITRRFDGDLSRLGSELASLR